MKLLLDENLSRRIIPFIQNDYSGSTQIALLDMSGAQDKAVWQYAKDNDFVIVTKDSDFYDLSLVQGSPPKMIWLQSGNVLKSVITSLLINNKEQLEKMLLIDDKACVELYKLY